jgi:hypothetical protein
VYVSLLLLLRSTVDGGWRIVGLRGGGVRV